METIRILGIVMVSPLACPVTFVASSGWILMSCSVSSHILGAFGFLSDNRTEVPTHPLASMDEVEPHPPPPPPGWIPLPVQ